VSKEASRIWNVLFLCTGNSARSLLAEMALARLGGRRFSAFSAGSQPKKAPHPVTLTTLTRLGYDISGLRSKSWDEFSGDDAPRIDLVLTVCGNAAGETCPVWSGKPVVGHWGVKDPAAFVGSPEAQADFFEKIHDELVGKIETLVAIDPSKLSREELTERIREIGEG